MERFKSTLAATAAIALGLAAAAHIRHPGDLSPVPGAEAAVPAAPAAPAWTSAQRDLLAMMADRAAESRAIPATVGAFAGARS